MYNLMVKAGHLWMNKELLLPNVGERGRLDKVNGIVVHQTNSPTAQSTFNSYSQDNANGAHFLIGKDGKIYQTASLHKTTWHVGQMKSLCYIKKRCSPTDLKNSQNLEKSWGNYKKISDIEREKTFPNRFPSNIDSIGIEIVGMAYEVKAGKDKVYERVNDKQNDSLKWLIAELTTTLHVPMSEIYRHPDIARKNPTEASTAKW